MNTKRLSVGTVILLAGCYAASDRFIVFNSPPAVTILLPAEGSTYEEDDGIVFQGRVSDNQPLDTLLIAWESSLDGSLANLDVPDPDGYLELATASLSPGSHVITLRATDDDGDQGEARVTVIVEEAPEHPSIEVVAPQNNGQGLEGFPYEFLVRVDDHQTPVQELLVDGVYTVGSGGVATELCLMVPDTTGLATCSRMMPVGTYLLTFTVTDTDGYTSSRNVVFNMVAEGDYDGDGDGFTPNSGDCNDDLDTVHPGATEICDGLDNDCEAFTAIDQGSDCWDDDSDNYCERGFNCANASGVGSDCNDLQPFIHPNATETANGIDDDCDGLIDEGTSRWDDDLDGYCETPPCVNVAGSTASSPSDCNDNNNQVKPTTTTVPWPESCATVYDDNCNQLTNEQNAAGATKFYRDNDGDTFYTNGQQSYEMWCAAQPPFEGTRSGDCYDSSAAAHPYFSGATQVAGGPYYTSNRGDGSYDYDCIQGQQRRDTALTSCAFSNFSCNGTLGWVGTVPSCGNSGSWQDDCEFDWSTLLIGCGVPCVIACGFGGTTDCFQCIAQECPGALTCDTQYAPNTQACR